MKIIFYCIFLLAGLLFQGCAVFDGPCEKGKGDIVVRTLAMTSFTDVKLLMAATVTIERGETLQVEIAGQPNILDLINTQVSDGEWAIYNRECVASYEKLEIRITMPTLRSINHSSSGIVQVNDRFEGDVDLHLSGSGQITYRGGTGDLAAVLSGSGKINIDGAYGDVTLNHSGSGLITAVGSAEFLKATCSGSGAVAAYEMPASEAQAVVSGSGSCYVTVTSTLEASVSGSGSVFYRGNPQVNGTDTGSGSIVNDN